jgi:hypothetical protein
MIENMSAPNQKGRIDPASLLDDYTTPNPFLYNRLAQPKVVADVTTSAEAQPLKRQVQPFVGGYSSYPAPRGKQTTLDNANTGHIQFACDDKHHATHVTPLNMHLQNNIVSQRMMVKECVKTVLFRRLKFYKKDLHGLYDLRNGTVCAMADNCELQCEHQRCNPSVVGRHAQIGCEHSHGSSKQCHQKYAFTIQRYVPSDVAKCDQTQCLHTCLCPQMVCVVKFHISKSTKEQMPTWNIYWT